jgi:two-component system phosphate regulon sensor histidine kinase PhoR
MDWTVLILVLAAGALVWLHLWWRARFRFATDIAQRKLEAHRHEQEQAALQFQARQEAIFNSMVEGLLVLDGGGRIQLANRSCARLFGTDIEFRGKTLIEALRLHELADLAGSLSASQPVLGSELTLPGERERTLEVNAAAILDPAGQLRGSVLVFHDLTRLKKLERTREEFVANVSHELRTPLSLIKGYAETLLDGAGQDPEVLSRFLQIIDRNAERLRLLIEDLLTISELESGRVKLECQSIDLKPVIDKVLADYQARAAAKGTRLENRAPSLLVHADANRLEQVLSNLLDNAIKYGKPAGNVTLQAQVTGSAQVEIAVHDDGPGIPPAALERIFERFYRLDKGRSRDQGGTGLGLAIVKHIVQSHGGKVWAESSPGHGAAFYFTLPFGRTSSAMPHEAQQKALGA